MFSTNLLTMYFTACKTINKFSDEGDGAQYLKK